MHACPTYSTCTWSSTNSKNECSLTIKPRRCSECFGEVEIKPYDRSGRRSLCAHLSVLPYIENGFWWASLICTTGWNNEHHHATQYDRTTTLSSKVTTQFRQHCFYKNSTMQQPLFQLWGSVRCFGAHCSMAPSVPSTILRKTLSPRAQSPGKSLQAPNCCTTERMLNKSQHHSYSNMPISRWCDWPDGSSGMRKKFSSLNRVRGKT